MTNWDDIFVLVSVLIAGGGTGNAQKMVAYTEIKTVGNTRTGIDIETATSDKVPRPSLLCVVVARVSRCVW